MTIKEFDTVILGGGPAGFSAGMYASRGAVSTAIIDVNMLGGQPSNYLELENYPGFSAIGGFELMEKFEEHADKFGVEKLAEYLVFAFDTVAPKFYSENDAKRGYMTLKGESYTGRRVEFVSILVGGISEGLDKIGSVDYILNKLRNLCQMAKLINSSTYKLKLKTFLHKWERPSSYY